MTNTAFIFTQKYQQRNAYILRIGPQAFRWKSCAKAAVKALRWLHEKGYQSSHHESAAQFWQAYAKEVTA